MFPKWSHRYMQPRAKGRVEAYRGRQYPDHSISKIVRLPGQMRDWQIKCVCGGTHLTCNGGWMKKIEDQARPIMIPLIVGHESRIYPADQAIIATWAVLKSMVSDFDREAHVTVHHTQRRRMKTRHLPPQRGWGVWIGHYERKNWKPQWISQPLLLLSEEDSKSVRAVRRPILTVTQPRELSANSLFKSYIARCASASKGGGSPRQMAARSFAFGPSAK